MEEEEVPVLQEYVPPPEAVSVALLPVHIVVALVTEAIGPELIVTTAVSVALLLFASVINTV